MDVGSSRISRKPTSRRKVEANRRNAAKSTGPRTAQGKSWSRLNALKHGVLASQAVIATIEGPEKRKLFEAMADGLAQDFAPVGAYEELLVQEIAACFWRKRRLLVFENRAAFEVRDLRAKEIINHPKDNMDRSSLYNFRSKLTETDFIYPAAGLDGITLPNEADTARVIRYEGAITRVRERAHAALKASQTARSRQEHPAEPAPHQSPMAIDQAAKLRNAGPDFAAMQRPWVSIRSWEELDDAGTAIEKNLQELKALGYGGKPRQFGETKPKYPRNLSTIELIDGITSGAIDPEEWYEQQMDPERDEPGGF